MEFETIYKDYGPHQRHGLGQQQQSPLRHQHQQDWQESQQGSWLEEFAKVQSEGAMASPPVSSSNRRGSVKICGFMLDPKHPSLDDFEALDGISAVEARANAVTAAVAASASYNILRDMEEFHPPMSSIAQPMTTEHYESTTTHDLVSTERPGQIFNDDVFEGDMLQAWMDTLAQEKQEAVEEKEREAAPTVKDSEISEADRLVLETAVRRLNALMHQLDKRPSPPPPLPPSPRMDLQA